MAGLRRGYNIESCLVRALERLGHEVFFFDIMHDLPLIRTHQIFRSLGESSHLLRKTLMHSGISEMDSELEGCFEDRA